MNIPLLYPILDADGISAGRKEGESLRSVCAFALALAEAGCMLVQYRAKKLGAREVLTQTRELRRLLSGITLIIGDRVDLCVAAGFDGVHLDQEGLSPM